MGLDNPSHWLIIAVLVIAFFGYKKLPDISRSVGRSLRIFKTEMKGLTEDDEARQATAGGQPSQTSSIAPQAHPEPSAPAQPVVQPFAQSAPQPVASAAAQPVAQPAPQQAAQPAPQQVAGQPAPEGATVPVNPTPAPPAGHNADGAQPQSSSVGE